MTLNNPLRDTYSQRKIIGRIKFHTLDTLNLVYTDSVYMVVANFFKQLWHHLCVEQNHGC